MTAKANPELREKRRRARKKTSARARLNAAICLLDDEAFSWLARSLLQSAMLHGASTQVWPDGLGGFRDRETIERARTDAAEYLAYLD